VCLNLVQPVEQRQLSSGKIIEFRIGTYENVHDINMRDHAFYSTIELGIGRNDTSYFMTASFSDLPLDFMIDLTERKAVRQIF